MIINWFDDLFNGICNGLVTVAEHPMAAGALALGAAIAWAGLSLRSRSHR